MPLTLMNLWSSATIMGLLRLPQDIDANGIRDAISAANGGCAGTKSWMVAINYMRRIISLTSVPPIVGTLNRNLQRLN